VIEILLKVSEEDDRMLIALLFWKLHWEKLRFLTCIPLEESNFKIALLGLEEAKMN
jgi:hypothetical protein